MVALSSSSLVKPEIGETWKTAMEEAFRFFTYLKHGLKWSYGSLGRLQGIVDTRWEGDSTGILFSHRNFAEEAKTLYKEWRKDETSLWLRKRILFVS